MRIDILAIGSRGDVQPYVALGLGLGQRACNIIELLKEFHEAREIHYTGIDLFESRTAADGPGISLREAHCLLKPTGARIQLAPGNAGEALARIANSVSRVDILLISGTISAEQLSQCWFYLPRMIHTGTQVFQEFLTAGSSSVTRLLEAKEVEQLMGQGERRAA